MWRTIAVFLLISIKLTGWNKSEILLNAPLRADALVNLVLGGSNQFQHFQETLLLEGLTLQHFIT